MAVKLYSQREDKSAPNVAARRKDCGNPGIMKNCQLVDMEEPSFRGKSMAQVDKEVWAKDVAALKAMGVNLKGDHMDGYLLKASREEEDMSLPPFVTGTSLDKMDMKPSVNTTIEKWNNPYFKFEIVGAVAYMTLNRPDDNNSLTGEVEQGLVDAIRILQKRPDVRVAILTGEGRLFCAGQGLQPVAGDTKGLARGESIVGQYTMASVNKDSACAMAKMFYNLGNLPQYTVCCCQGSSMGTGVGLACVCDMTIMVKWAQISLAEVKLGNIPAAVAPYIIARAGAVNAKKLLCTGENLNAQKAQSIGIVHNVVETMEDFAPIIEEVCKKVQALAPSSVAQCKDIMNKSFSCPISQSLVEYTAQMYAKTRKGAEAEAGMKALTEKKRPAWVEDTIAPRWQ